MKKFLLPAICLSLINFISAYGSETGFNIAGTYLDIDLIASVAIFMLIFLGLVSTTRKMNTFHTDGARIFISLIISMFSVYGLSKLNISYEALFIDWGIQNILMEFSLIIIIIAIAILWIMFNFKTVIAVFAGAFALMGIIGMASNIIYNWGISLVISAIFGAIYFWLKKKSSS